jgi:hypothetical protein
MQDFMAYQIIFLKILIAVSILITYWCPPGVWNSPVAMFTDGGYAHVYISDHKCCSSSHTA